MTEEGWLAGNNPPPMVWYLEGKASLRKLWFFACSCCRAVWSLIPDERTRHCVAQIERYFDGLATEEELLAAQTEAWAAATNEREIWLWRRWECHDSISRPIELANWSLERQLTIWLATAEHVEVDPDLSGMLQQRQCDLLRHIIGNPFQPYAAPAHWPLTVIQLAEALYEGEDCNFALHDTLLEAGHAELAGHFEEKEHPKGCWAMDMILGKK
jgi:hypothetical protein